MNRDFSFICLPYPFVSIYKESMDSIIDTHSGEEGIVEVRDEEEIFSVVNDAARRYKGVIPEDRWHEPYMPMEEVQAELKRMRIYGYREGMKLLGVMGKEQVRDVTLVRHAYVLSDNQGKGIGSKLLTFIERGIDTQWLLIGTWKAAFWAIDFYKKHGYEMMEKKDELLRTYWEIPDRQIETSCVLGKRMS
jgi:GNAT superfamily N-acetyltransferase